MRQWYLSYNGQQEGPFGRVEAVRRASENPDGYCWRTGFAEWLPIARVTELSDARPPAPTAPPPAAHGATDVVDYQIYGEDMQFVEIELDPGESAVAEAGAMMYKDTSIGLDTLFGDGSHGQASAGVMDKLVGAGKRLITGEGLFITVFTHNGTGKAKVSFAAPYPGTVIPVTLKNFGGTLICQKDSFLCAARGVSIGIHFQKKILTGLFGGEGFIMQKLSGDGLVFLHAGGTIVERDLKAGEQLQVDTGCLVALTDTVAYDVQKVGGIKSMVFGGEGVFFANVAGPGKVWMQSLPFSRLAGRLWSALPQRGGSRGEGSVLGGLGRLLDGDGSF